MFKLIEDLPPDVMGIEATGKVTHEDYQNLPYPQGRSDDGQRPGQAAVCCWRRLRGLRAQALWDDSAFGVKHWND